MIRSLIVLIILINSFDAYAQEKCKSGMFSFKQEDGFYSHSLVKDGEIFPFRNQVNQDLLFRTMCTKILLFETDTTIKSIKYDNVKSSLIKTKASLTLCYDSFVEQITPFLKGEVKEVVLNSQKGIPFLTFTRKE